MKKKLFIFFLFLFSSISTFSYSKDYCNNQANKEIIKNIDNLEIRNISVEFDNYRKWTKNSLKILTGNFRWIPKKYKKRFDAEVIVDFDKDLICSFKARVRHSGDQKDHISLKGNSIIQSLDVHLKNGNIYGITKFKLLMPMTRGNFEDEIFLTEILRELNYLAPRTNYVKAKINGVDSQMIFQEKAAKEMLEYNRRREGPIFEGDERFLFSELNKIQDNNLSNESNGTLPLLENGVKAMFAKQTNSKWINRSIKHSQITHDSLSNLNLAYLLYSNRYKDEKNNFDYRNYNLDNNLLGLGNDDNILKLDIYNLIVYSANGWHGLTPNNRKFYWNSIENYFEPINYDSNANINSEPSVLRLPASEQMELAFNDTKDLLNKINTKKLTQKINFRGLNLNNNSIEKKIAKLKKNLFKLKNLYSNIDDETLLYNNNNIIDKNMWRQYYESMHKINPDVYYVEKIPETNSYKVCKIKPKNCKNHKFSEKQVMDLVEGQLVINKEDYQYLGFKKSTGDIFKLSGYKNTKILGSNFYFKDGIEYNHDENKNEINIVQLKPTARAFFYKGLLKDLKITFNGYKENANSTPLDYPIDKRGLTGCLSFIYLKVDNINIKSNNSNCEDNVNLINVEGTINSINIKNSFSDGLDVDFSDVSIKNINISESGNDCVDFSSGIYKLNKLNLSNCGDKALSIGEKSSLELNEIFAQNSNIGIASKDSSVTQLNNVILKNTKTCVSAYNKKQEFFGSLINIKNIECKNYKLKTEIDKTSNIFIENDI